MPVPELVNSGACCYWLGFAIFGIAHTGIANSEGIPGLSGLGGLDAASSAAASQIAAAQPHGKERGCDGVGSDGEDGKIQEGMEGRSNTGGTERT
eukprot:Skav235281  [mRNA]  locus=scaffold874:414006:417206:- [translate_table: standard]